MSEARFNEWGEPVEAKPVARARARAATPEAPRHPLPQPPPAPVEVSIAPATHCAPAPREFSQALTLRPGDAAAEERLAELEDKIYAANLRIVDDMTYWADVDLQAEAPKEEWVRELGVEGARRRHRVACAANMSLKDAPIGISAAKSIVSSLAKARAVREAGRGGLSLNVTAIFPTQVNVYEELVVKDD